MNVAFGPDKIGEQYQKNSEKTLLAFQQIINGHIEKTRPGKDSVFVASNLFNNFMITDAIIDAICSFYKAAGWALIYWDNGFTLVKEGEAEG